jgi:hypothetical protein
MFPVEERYWEYTTIDFILKNYKDTNNSYNMFYNIGFYPDPHEENDIECFYKPLLSKVLHFYPEQVDFIKKLKKIIKDYQKN